MSDDKIYMAENGLTKARAFLERKKYKEAAVFSTDNFVDLWYNKPNYGLLNSNFEPVVLLTDAKDTSLSAFEGVADGVKVASFVADAFRDFREEYMRVLRDTPVQPVPYIGTLSPTKGHEKFYDRYIDYINILTDYYLSRLEDEKSRIGATYESFESVLWEIMEPHVLSGFPVTRSGFLLSKKCPNSVSGLYIELSKMEFPKDSGKQIIINSRGFPCYVELSDEFGFYIDKNAPWRLIANLESKKMQQYISRYEPNIGSDFYGYKKILAKLFRVKTQYDDIYSLQNFAISLYNKFIDRFPMGSSRAYDPPTGEVKEKAFIRKSINLSKSKLSRKYWLSFLLKIRMLEIGMGLEEYERRNQEVLDYHDSYSSGYKNPLLPALGKIGSICSSYLEEMYSKNLKIDSFQPVKLSDYY